jgi:DNA invertase Pin-like site-specific DNA recombinase
MSNRCAIYSRYSTSGQTVENQIRKLKEIAERRGVIVVSRFSHEAISGSKGRDQRKKFYHLIKGAVRKDFDLILVWSVDRLGRSLQDLVSFLNENHSVDCDLYIHQSGIDTTTPSGKMMFQMCGVFAEFERGMTSDRVKWGQERAKSQGKHIGRPSNLNEGLSYSIKYMREQGVGIRRIATDLKVGVSTVYKVLEAT